MMDTIDDAWLGLGLLALRWWAVLSVQVLWQRAVGLLWPLVAAGLAVVLALGGGVGSTETVVAGDPGVLIGAELLLGGLVGLAIALPGYALLGASGASAQVLGVAPGPWRLLTVCFVAAVALGLGLHRPLLLAGQALEQAWPVGRPEVWVEGAATVPLPQLAHALALVALTLATPALLAGAVAELSARLWAHGPAAVAPGGPTVAPVLRMAAALCATGASWSAYDAVWAERAVVPGGLLVGIGL